MISKKLIEEELDQLYNLQDLMGIYEEIAAMRMKKIRDMVLKNREFLEGLGKVFQEVKTAYKKQLLALMHKKHITDINKLSIRPTNGKKAYVYISANVGLYGPIIKSSFELFSKEYVQEPADVFLVGKVGKTMFEKRFPGVPHTFISFSDERIDSAELIPLMEQLVQYDSAIAFHGIFQSLLSQTPLRNPLSSETVINDSDSVIHYFFEPSLESVATFFEKEIFASLLHQTVYESSLAKYASRMITLHTATNTLDGQIGQKKFTAQRVSHAIMNQKQVNLLSGMRLWHKKV